MPCSMTYGLADYVIRALFDQDPCPDDFRCTTSLKLIEYGVYQEYIGVPSMIIFYLIQDVCSFWCP